MGCLCNSLTNSTHSLISDSIYSYLKKTSCCSPGAASEPTAVSDLHKGVPDHRPHLGVWIRGGVDEQPRSRVHIHCRQRAARGLAVHLLHALNPEPDPSEEASAGLLQIIAVVVDL